MHHRSGTWLVLPACGLWFGVLAGHYCGVYLNDWDLGKTPTCKYMLYLNLSHYVNLSHIATYRSAFKADAELTGQWGP